MAAMVGVIKNKENFALRHHTWQEGYWLYSDDARL